MRVVSAGNLTPSRSSKSSSTLRRGITAQTTATAKASLQSYQTDLQQTLTSTSSGRVTGLEITEKWSEPRDGGTTMYVLARYAKNDLNREKRRLEEIFQEKIEAISHRCGYPNLNSFFAAFRRSENMTPAEYRRIMRFRS